MKIEVEVKYNIGDHVLVKKPKTGYYGGNVEPFVAVVVGYVIHKNAKSTKVYYTLEIEGDKTWARYQSLQAYNHKKRYGANELEKVGFCTVNID